MPRLIDADALMAHFAELQKVKPDKNGREYSCNFRSSGGEQAAEWYTIEDAVDIAPTIDAVPVRHGEWIKTDDNICYARICSVCRKHVRVCIGLRCHDCDTEANYCPNCGAKMRGERHEQ